MTNYDAALSNGTLRLSVITHSQDVATNSSILFWQLILIESSGASFNYNPISWAVTINGVYYSGSYTFDFSAGGNQSLVIAQAWTAVTHAPDGTGHFEVAGYTAYTDSPMGGPANPVGYYDPATIPRASTPTFEKVSNPGVPITSCDAGLAIKINTNRADSSFTHKLEYSIGSTGWQTIAASGVGASYSSWTIPLSLLNQIPTTTSGTISIRTTTYTNSGATLVGTTTTPLTMTAGATIVPDLGTITHSEATTTPNVASLIGAYVQGITKLNVAITSPTGIYGSTIKAQKIEVVGQAGNQITNSVATALSGTLPAYITASGTVTLRATVTDTRDRTYSEDVSITVLAYSLPTIVAPVTVQRSLSGGTPDEEGTYIRTNINASVQSLTVAAVQKNAISYRISTSPHGANTWTVKTTTTPGGLTFNSNAVVGTYSIGDSFDVKVEVYDKLSVLAFVLQIATSAVPFHLGADGVGIGKFNEGLFDLEVAGTIARDGVLVLDEDEVAALISAAVLAATPVGKIEWLAGSSIPSGFLACDGSAVSRTTYADLFTAIGTTWGVGNGSTTFNLPDLRARVPIAAQAATSLGTATFANATDLVTLNAHGLTEGDIVYFTGGTMPTGLTASTKYFARDVTTNTFKLASTLGGSAINFTSDGSGTRTLFVDNFSLGTRAGSKSTISTLVSAFVALWVGYFKSRSGATWTATNLNNYTSAGGSSTTSGNGVSVEGTTDAVTNLPPYAALTAVIKAA